MAIGTPMNGSDKGVCYAAGRYNIPQGKNGENILTESVNFTCVEFEVFLISWY